MILRLYLMMFKRFQAWLKRYKLKREAKRWVRQARRDARTFQQRQKLNCSLNSITNFFYNLE